MERNSTTSKLRRERKMKWPWSVKQKSSETLEIERLQQQRKLQEEKLRNAEVSDDVITAVKINALFNKLREGCKNEAEFDRRLSQYAEEAGSNAEVLRAEFSFKRGVQRLESMDEGNVQKLERLMRLDKQHRKVIGFEK